MDRFDPLLLLLLGIVGEVEVLLVDGVSRRDLVSDEMEDEGIAD